MRVRAVPAVVALVLLAAVPAAHAKRAGLRAFPSCPALVDYARAHGTQAVGTGWVPPAPVGAPRPIGVTGPVAPGTAQAQTEAGTTSSTQFSTTNVQEEGVDEPDVVKTDGKVIYAVAANHLYAIDATGDAPRLVGSLELPDGSGQELLVHGDRLLVLQNAWIAQGPVPPPGGGPVPLLYPIGRAVTRLTEVDVSDPAAMKVLSSERADGAYVSARLVGASVRVVVVSRPQVLEEVATISAPSTAKAVTRRRAAVRRARLGSWRPRAYVRRAGAKSGRLEPLVACHAIRHPIRFSGLDTVTVLTVDLARGLPAIDADSVMSDADIVYGSPTRLYVASQRWLAPQVLAQPVPPKTTTQISEFDVSDPDSTTYVGTGSVPGFLLNQYALSEQDGVLRVASTDSPSWWDGSPPSSSSFVTTLDAKSPALAQIGQVGDLGQGQRIYAVRFIGNVGYVVTFRQIDPLYTVDLSDPAHPRVLGSLELAGYSAYLHPIGDGLLLGVGQDAGADGVTRGTQLELFDVSDPANPKRLATDQVGSGSTSTVQFDPHAFLYWAPDKLAVIPVQIYDDNGGSPFTGAIGFHVDRGGISEAGRISHPETDNFTPTVSRALVIGSRLFTLSDGGLLSSDLATFAAGPWLPFPDAVQPIGIAPPPREPQPQPAGAGAAAR